MYDQDVASHIASLEARMDRVEMLMQQLLLIMTSSHGHREQARLLQDILQELRRGSDIPAASIYPSTFAKQESPELEAIRYELLAGNKLKAIKLYRRLYGVGLKEAVAAIKAL